MKLLVSILVISLFTLLFVGGPSDYRSRLELEVWGTGHFILFAGIIFLLLKFSPLKNKNFKQAFFITTVFCLTLGPITEGLQILVGRNFELIDIVNDLIGGYAGLLLAFLSSAKTLLKKLLIAFAMSVITVLGTWSLLIAIFDEYRMQKQFPVMANFENQLELSRWRSIRAELSVTREYVRHGQQSMKIIFKPHRKISEVFFQYFESDWKDYNKLNFSLFNTSNESFGVTLKIYDEEHYYSYHEYTDRFNLTIELKPGWNEINIPLNKIKAAPESRQIDLENIYFFSFFCHKLKQPKVVYLDYLYLSK
jgi:VanZ family protein